MTEERIIQKSGFTGNEASDEATEGGIKALVADNPKLAAAIDVWARGQILSYKILFFVGTTPWGAAAISSLIAASTGVTIPPAVIMAAAAVGKDATLKIEAAYKAAKDGEQGQEQGPTASQDGERRSTQAKATQGGVRRGEPVKSKAGLVLLGAGVVGALLFVRGR